MITRIVNTIALFTAITILIAFTGCESNPTTSTNTNPTQNVLIKTLGDQNSELFYKTIKTSDGGFLSVGRTVNHGAYDDMFVLKTNPALGKEWARYYSTNGQDVGYDVIELSGGDLIIAGNSTGPTPPYTGTWITKMSANGTVKWSEFFISGFNGYDGPPQISKCSESSFLVFAYPRYSPVVTVKMDTSGAVVNSIQHTGLYLNNFAAGLADGGAMLIGGNCVSKLNSDGSFGWCKDFSDTFAGLTLVSAIQDQNGNFICCGSCHTSSANPDGLLMKLSGNGIIMWAKGFGTTGMECLGSVISISSGLVSSGYVHFYGQVISGFVAAFGNEGDLKWVSSTALGTPDFRNIFLYPDGGFVVFSKIDYSLNSGADVGIFKLNSTGQSCFNSDTVSYSITDVPLSVNVHTVEDTTYTVVPYDLPVTVTDVSLNENTICTH